MENYTTFMLLDKGYYDYDYEMPGTGGVKQVLWKETQEEKDRRTQRMMDRFGFDTVKRVGAELSAEELQEAAIGDKE